MGRRISTKHSSRASPFRRKKAPRAAGRSGAIRRRRHSHFALLSALPVIHLTPVTTLRRIALLSVALLLLNGCIRTQASFSVRTGAPHRPEATKVFADADTYAHRRGFYLDEIQAMRGGKIAYYHRDADYLSIEHRTDSRTVDFELRSNNDPYNDEIARRFVRGYMQQYTSEYGAANIQDR